jgi:hypothetical protein
MKMTVVKLFTKMNSDLQILVLVEAGGISVLKVLYKEVRDFVDMVCLALSICERVVQLYW